MVKMTKKQQQAENILRHGFALQRLYPETRTMGPVSLCKALHRVEAAAHRFAEENCNGVPERTDTQIEAKSARLLASAKRILGAGPEIILNGDPRGYALKIDSDIAKGLDIYKDWGGNGIICPEF